MDPSQIAPIPMRLTCPECRELHIDEGDFATKSHHTHACQHCGHVWRPAVVPTVGVKFLPGFKATEPAPALHPLERQMCELQAEAALILEQEGWLIGRTSRDTGSSRLKHFAERYLDWKTKVDAFRTEWPAEWPEPPDNS